MRIAYVCYWNLAVDDGVSGKIRAQVDAWRTRGHEVESFAIAPGAVRERWRRTRDAASGVARFAPGLVYLRYDRYLPPVWTLANRFRTVVEVNSRDRAELRLRGRRSPAAVAFNDLNRRVLVGAADGFVAVTHELARGLAGRGQPVEVIANGIDVDSVRAVPAPRNGAPPSVVFLGSARQAWHGVDKIARLAELRPELRFEVVGFSPDELGRRVPSNVRVHPQLGPHEYGPILARSDVALGTLALHRKGMDEACPLKVREYLAHGLPVVIAYRDTDFLDEQPWYVLHLPNDEANVETHAREIGRFVAQMRGRRVPRDELVPRIDLARKEERRLAFLERVAAGRHRHASSAAS